MTDRQHIVSAVAQRLRQVLPEVGDGPLGESDDLRSFATFDSLSFMEVLAWLEAEFDAVIPDEELLPENFDSVGKIADYVITYGPQETR